MEVEVYRSLGFGSRLLHIAPSVVRHGLRVALQFSPIMNKRHMNLWDRRSKSARTPLLDTGRTGEESAADGLADYLEETPAGLKAHRLPVPNQPLAQFSLSELSIRNGMPLSERRAWGFDLAADFLYSIVISVDLMTFQTMDIGITARKLAGAELGGAIDTVASSVCAGIDEHLSSSRRFPCNSLKSSILGV